MKEVEGGAEKEGEIMLQPRRPFSPKSGLDYIKRDFICPVCNGTGRIENNLNSTVAACYNCGGTGRVKDTGMQRRF